MTWKKMLAVGLAAGLLLALAAPRAWSGNGETLSDTDLANVSGAGSETDERAEVEARGLTLPLDGLPGIHVSGFSNSRRSANNTQLNIWVSSGPFTGSLVQTNRVSGSQHSVGNSR